METQKESQIVSVIELARSSGKWNMITEMDKWIMHVIPFIAHLYPDSLDHALMLNGEKWFELLQKITDVPPADVQGYGTRYMKMLKNSPNTNDNKHYEELIDRYNKKTLDNFDGQKWLCFLFTDCRKNAKKLGFKVLKNDETFRKRCGTSKITQVTIGSQLIACGVNMISQ